MGSYDDRYKRIREAYLGNTESKKTQTMSQSALPGSYGSKYENIRDRYVVNRETYKKSEEEKKANAERESRQQMQKELEQLRTAYAAYDKPEMQGIADNRSWEEIYAENEERNKVGQRIKMLENQTKVDESEAYYQEVLKRLSKLDEETVSYVDQLNAGMPDEGLQMQGVADNRSWEDRYAEQQNWENELMRKLSDKGYSRTEITQMRKDRERQVNRENYEAEIAESQQEATDNGFLASVKSIPQNLSGGLGTISLAAQNAHKNLTGDDTPVDYYTPEMIGQAKAQTARQTVTKRLEDNDRNVAAFLYNTGMSMADSAAVAGMAALGVPPAAGTALLGGSAAIQAARDAKERGVSDEQALWTGLAAGAAEMIFEKISLDRLLATSPTEGVLRQRLLQSAKNIGKQSFTEGSEELFTSVANSIADAVINGEKSYYNQSIYNYMMQGMEYGEAVQAATRDWAASLAQDFLAGAISGGVMGGVATEAGNAFANMDANAFVREQYGNDPQVLVDRALEIDPKSKTAQIAAKRLKDGKKLDSATMRSLVMQTARAKVTAEGAEANPSAVLSAAVEQMVEDANARKKASAPVTESDSPKTDFTEEEARYIVEEGAKEFGNAASSVVNSYIRSQDPQLYMAQAKLAFNYGKTMSEEKGLPYALNSPALKSLDETQIRSLFNAGRMQAKSIPVSAVKGTGKAVMADGLDYTLLSPGQKKQVDALSAFAKATGYTIEFFESKVGEDGRYTAEQGSFNTKTGVIRIDINAGRDKVTDLTNYAMVRVASHEITHSFKKNAPQQYVALRDYVTGVLADKGRFEDLVDTKMRDLNIDHETAVDEVVADGCEMLLRDTRFAEQLAKENRTLFEKIRDAIRKFVKKLRDAFEGVEIAHEEALLLKDAENLQKLWDEALAKSVENVAAAEATTTEGGGEKLLSTRDSEYMEAVRNGDMEAAQRMVDEAARAAGYTIEAYHGTNAEFFTFDKGRVGKGQDVYGAGFYFADSEEAAESYGKRIIPAYLRLENPYRITVKPSGGGLRDIKLTQKQVYEILKRHPKIRAEDGPLGDFFEEFWETGAKDWMIRSLARQYDDLQTIEGDLFRDYPNELHEAVRDVTGHDGIEVYFQSDETGFSPEQGDTFYVAWFDNQMKSSEAVVHDDAGEIIPPSQRFDESQSDIRYSRRDERERFAQQVDEVRKNTFNASNHVLMGSTPVGISKVLDLPQIPVMMTPTHVYSIAVSKAQAVQDGKYSKKRNYHDLGWNLVKELPQILDRPVAIIKSNNDPDDARFVVVTNKTDSSGRPVVVAFEPGGTGRHFNIEFVSNVMLSGYGRNSFQNFLQTAKTENRILYANKKNSQTNKGSPGVQFPDAIFAFDYSSNLSQFKVAVKKRFSGTVFENSGLPQVNYSFRTGYIPTDRSILTSYVPKDSDSNMIKRHIAEYQKNLEELRKLEQALREQREQMRSITGDENKVQRAKLREEIVKTQNRIHIANEQLRRKESWMGVRTVLNREKDALVKQAKAEEREKLTKYREQRWDTESRRKMRERISYRVKTLDKMLREPTDDKHIPEELRKAVFDFCKVFQDEVGVFSQKQLDRLSVAYEKLAKETEGENASFLYDEDIKEMISQLGVLMDGKRLSELSVEALKFVRNIADHMYFIVRDENEVFLNGRKVKMQTIATKAIEEAKESEKKGGLTIGRDGDAFLKFLTSGNLKPVYLFERTGNQLRDLFNGLLAGQSEYGRREQRAKAFVEQVKKDTNYSKWSSSEETLKMKNGAGQEIELTVQQAMSLLATYERELRSGKTNHVTMGGFVYENGLTGDVTVKGVKVPVVKRKVEAEAHPMTVEDMDKVRSWLGEVDPRVLDYMEKMVEYLSTTMSEYGNETSMQLHGYKKFGEDYYFPIRSSDEYLSKDPGKGGFDENRWKNKGFTKTVDKGANNQFVLIDFDKVWSNHVSQMLMYSTMAVPQESFVRVLNFKTPVDPTGLSNSDSMRSVITQYYGSKVADYIDTLLQDVNGGVTTDSRENALNRFVSLYKKNAVLGSMSVTVQQISSVARAMAIIDPKYFTKGKPFADFQEALEHSGVAVIKQMGGFDTTTGRGGAEWLMEEVPGGKFRDAKSFSEGLKMFVEKGKALTQFGEKDTGYRDRWLGALPARMDELGFGMIWNAAKNEVSDGGEYEDGTEAFYEAVTKRFEEVIEKTQVYDSVLSRSENMRSKGNLMKAATSFMAEPTVTANMMTDAVWKLRRNKDEDSRKYLGRVIAALLFSVIANNFLKAFATAPRDKDKDQTIVEKWFEDFVGGTVNDLIVTNYIPYLREVTSAVMGYGVEATWFAPAEDLINATMNWIRDGEFSWGATKDIVNAVSALKGLPTKNLLRIPESIINLFANTASIKEWSWRGMENAALEGILGGLFMPGVDDAIEKAYKADKRGNEAQRKKALDEIVRLYEDKAKQFRLEGKQDAAKKAKSSLKSSITAELKPLYQAATTQAEKNRIKSLALRVYVGGEQLYNGYDFERYWGEE